MEQQFIRWLEENAAQLTGDRDSVRRGIGDDGAILESTPGLQVLVSDSIIDKVHFDIEAHELDAIGYKAIAVNLSDIAAMGAKPETALVSLVLPSNMSIEDTKRLFGGMLSIANEYGVAIVGGDTCKHDGPLVVNVAMTGRIDPEAKCPEGWNVGGARPGDLLVVTGPLGGSILGKHLGFVPRVELACAIQESTAINAATDISDSLLVDLAHVVRKSNVGAVLEQDSVPVSDSARKLSTTSGKPAIEHALTDGEDFELLLCMSPDAHAELCHVETLKAQMYVIGTVVDHDFGKIIDSKTGESIAVRGYEH